MDELTLYKKMYATVVGEVDLTIQSIEKALGGGGCDWGKLAEVCEKLKHALAEAEELYLSADGEE